MLEHHDRHVEAAAASGADADAQASGWIMTMHEEWTDKLSDYLDGELPADEQRAVEAHLRECADCTGVLERSAAGRRAGAGGSETPRALRRPTSGPASPNALTRADAGVRRPAGPSDNVTAFRRRASRRIAFTLPQLAAAALVVAAVSGGLAWQLRPAQSGSRRGRVAPLGVRGRGASAILTGRRRAQRLQSCRPDGAERPRRDRRPRRRAVRRGGGRPRERAEGGPRQARPVDDRRSSSTTCRSSTRRSPGARGARGRSREHAT